MKNALTSPARRRFIFTSAAISGGFAPGLQLPSKAQDVCDSSAIKF